MTKKRVLFAYLAYPFTIANYFRHALEKRPNVELFTVGAYTGDFIPWGNGMRLPARYVKDVDLKLPAQIKAPSWEMVENKLQGQFDLVINVDEARWIDRVLKNLDGARDYLHANLKRLKHKYLALVYKVPFNWYEEHHDGVYDLSARQLLRVWAIVRELRRPRFRNQIGRLLEEDIADKFNEHGGLVVFGRRGNLVFEPKPSLSAKKQREKYNDSYHYSADWLAKPHVFFYHQHANERDSGE